MRTKRYVTGFETETAADFFADVRRIYTVDDASPIRHLQIPCIHRHSSGQWLVSCRVDMAGESERKDAAPAFAYAFGEMLRFSSEGDSTNEQALFFSRDDGRTWEAANGGRPIITLDRGTSFAAPSGIPHSMIYEDAYGDTWMYYTINQPYTCGAGSPGRSTGGGEIRKVRIVWDGVTWTAAERSEVVWGFMQPLSDGKGGTWDRIRTASLNEIVETSAGTLLLPIMGRTTVEDPRGDYWRFNRCWVLESTDGGRTWPNSYFIGGSNRLCLCEPTIVETGTPGELVAYMRAQYGTGNELYRSVSADYGRTWSAPEPTGLPNTNASGTKPFLLKLRGGDYVLLQTNEHFTDDRTNMAVFKTDEDGLRRNAWRLVKTLWSECDGGWKGSCYAWAEEGPDGDIHAVFASFDAKRHYLNYARVSPDWLEGTVFEPVAPNDARGNDLPRISEERAAEGGRSLKFVHVRGRAGATKFSRLEALPIQMRHRFLVAVPPKADAFHLLHVSGHNGRELAFTVSLRPDRNDHVWICANGGWIDSGIAYERDAWTALRCVIESETDFRVMIGDRWATDGRALRMLTDARPDTLLVGGHASGTERCEIYIDDIAYGVGSEDLR